ncbi:hypothetical protein Trco_000886 [Trichoderma cornu-damae]|uniref:Uncharacterized protein n=1 Tax=Trichoderma cornu-damae TaxID=654480 RepID=A0A9P8TWR7_9HYPO|nr:hypothetical protein Trco_000886 [Trichoderma cornu-damae]
MAMFCSSLRQRKDWAAVVPALSRNISSGWKETILDGHDVAFALAPQSNHRPGGSFKLALLSAAEAQKTAEAKARIERLSMLDGGRNVAVVLLLGESGRVDSLIDLQTSLVTHDMAHVPIIPVSSAAELVARLDALRRQCTASAPSRSRAEETAEIRGLASRCVHGPALSGDHVNVLTDMSTGLGSLAQLAFSQDGRRKLCDLLGDAEGTRVISFFTDGHEARRVGVW